MAWQRTARSPPDEGVSDATWRSRGRCSAPIRTGLASPTAQARERSLRASSSRARTPASPRRLTSVEIAQHIKQLVGPVEYLRNGNGTPLMYDLAQVIADDKLHDDKTGVVFGEMVFHVGKGLVMELGQELRFTLEGIA